MAEALREAFGEAVQFTLPAGGLSILARFPDQGSDMALAARAARHGLAASPLSARSIKYGAGEGLLLSFTNVPEKEASLLAQRLKRALAGTARRQSYREVLRGIADQASLGRVFRRVGREALCNPRLALFE